MKKNTIMFAIFKQIVDGEDYDSVYESPAKNHPLISVKVFDSLGKFCILQNVTSAVVKKLSYKVIKHSMSMVINYLLENSDNVLKES